MEKKKLLVLHGALGSKDQFKKLTELLKDSFELHCINLNGHGDRILSTGFSLRGFEQDLLDFLDQEKQDQINIFGYSMGGYVALYLAQNHPGRVEKIMTLGTKFDWNPEIASREIKSLDPSKIEEKVPEFARILKERHQSGWKEVLAYTADFIQDLGNHNYLDRLEEIQIPILLALGDRDNMVSQDETIGLCERLKNGTLTILPDTAHPIEKVNAEALVRKLKRFFS